MIRQMYGKDNKKSSLSEIKDFFIVGFDYTRNNEALGTNGNMKIPTRFSFCSFQDKNINKLLI